MFFRKPGAYTIYLILSGGTSFFWALVFTVTAVYRVQEAGLNPLQLVLVGTTLEVAYFLVNVPTGVVADMYSRKLSVVIGVFLFGMGMMLEGSVPLFAAILLAQVVEANGYAFLEGALEAWITDEVGEENVGRVFLRGAQVEQATGFAGIFASVGLASISLNLPIILGGALFLALGVYLLLAMPETRFSLASQDERSSAPDSLRDMRGTLRDGARVVRRRPLALTILAIALVFGGFSEGFDRLWEAHFLQSIGLPELGAFEPVMWFGIIGAGSRIIGFVATWIAGRKLNVANPNGVLRVLFALNVLLIGSVIVFALAGNFALALGAFWVGAVTRSLQYPVYTTWLNQNVDSRVRATVLSMSGQADSLGQFTVGPVLGTLGTVFSLRVALATAGAALSPALLLYGRALKKGTVEPALPEADPAPAVTET